MICFTLFHMEICMDFTAPAWLALLSILLPERAFLRTLAAALLHESAHFFMLALTHRRAQSLRLTAAGMTLRMQEDALCPLPAMCAVLLAGCAANAAAGAVFAFSGLADAAAVNTSLALFNLLPFSGTDGGTLLEVLLTHRLLTAAPENIARILRAVSLGTALVLAALLLACGNRNPFLWMMLLFAAGSFPLPHTPSG